MNLQTVRNVFAILGPVMGVLGVVVFNVLLFYTEIPMGQIIIILAGIYSISIISMINSDLIYGFFLHYWNQGAILKIGVVIGIIVDFMLRIQNQKTEKQIEKVEGQAKRQNDWPIKID